MPAPKQQPAAPATLQDVSAEAEVSVATVSRVLSGRGGVAEDKAQRVRAAVGAVGYTPLRQSRRPAPAAASPVALLRFSDDALARYSNDFSQTVKGVAAALAEEGIGLLYADLSGADALPEEVRGGRVRGVLLAGDDTRGLLRRLPDVPRFWITSHREGGAGGGDGASALAGNEHVGQLAADHLLGLGCRRLACLDLLAGSVAGEVRTKWFAFQAGAAGAEVTRVSSRVPLPAADDPRGWAELVEGAEAAVDELLDAGPAPDGLFVTNALLLGPVYRRLRRRGVEPGPSLRVVVSGHHEPVLAALDPRPASIDLRGEVIGRCAVQQLLHRVRRPGESLPVDLVVRAALVPAEPA